MRCDEVMRRPVLLCHDTETVQAAARKMLAGNIGFLPVCDENDRVVGAITDRDIALRVVAEGRSPGDTLVADAMTREIVCCSPCEQLERAERMMLWHRKSRIIVVTEGRPAGVISLSDLAALDGAHAAHALRVIASREVLGARGTRPQPQGVAHVR